MLSNSQKDIFPRIGPYPDLDNDQVLHQFQTLTNGELPEANQDPADKHAALIPLLLLCQHHFGWIPDTVQQWLANTLAMPRNEVLGVIEFYAFLHTQPPPAYRILLSNNITDQMLHQASVKQRLETALAANRVEIAYTSCTGLCEQGPAALVNGHAMSGLTPERTDELIEAIQQGVPMAQWPSEWFRIHPRIHRKDRLLNQPVAAGETLRLLVQHSHQQSMEALSRSKLRGRGGAGFSTFLKWDGCRQAAGDDKYVICNADEGEPGTFKDRVLLSDYADQVFEGMTACGYLIGARKGYLYLRAEYLFLWQPLQRILARRREQGLLGQSILGQAGFDFDIELHLGAGAYICGEETALIDSLEGKRGIPRIRPPFPTNSGYRRRPTVVNNVETFMAAAAILLYGAEWFNLVGTDQSKGTKVHSISGDCERPGLYEFPWGVTIGEMVEACGARDCRAVQIGGPSGKLLSPPQFDQAVGFETVSTGGSFMVFGKQRDPVDIVHNFVNFFAHESCGFCTPCRVGTRLNQDVWQKLQQRRAEPRDLQSLRDVSQLMQTTSHCGLGQTAGHPVLDGLTYFRNELEKRVTVSDHGSGFDLHHATQRSRAITSPFTAEDSD